MRFALMILTGIILLSSNAWAKKVSVEWRPIKGAISYEIQVIHNGKIIKAKKTEDNAWSGDLPFGLYEYHIRAVDKVNRPGKWSALRNLVAMPKEARNVFPNDGQKFSTYIPTAEMKFQWNGGDSTASKVSSIEKYHLIVKNSETHKVAIDEVIKGSETPSKKLPPGKYEWQVTGVIEKRGLASVPEKEWENKPSAQSEFTVEKLQLAAPDMIYPIGVMKPPKGGKMYFRWRPVEGAEAYQVILTPKKSVKKLIWVSKLPSSTLSLAREGEYSWEVRAIANIDSRTLASLDTQDAKLDSATELGAQSNASFELDRNSGFWNGYGEISFSTIYAPYSYSANSPSQNIEDETLDSAATAIKFSGEYWFKPQFGIGLSFQDSYLKVDGESFDFKDVEIDAMYRVNLTPGSNGWCLTSKLGIEHRDYVLFGTEYNFVPNSNGNGGSSQAVGLYDNSFGTAGPEAGVELRKQMTERLSLAVMANYFYPVGNGIVRGGDSNRNLGVGISGIDFLSKSWALGIGIYHENRSVTHQNDESNGPDTISMDANYLFGSLVYSFGRE